MLVNLVQPPPRPEQVGVCHMDESSGASEARPGLELRGALSQLYREPVAAVAGGRASPGAGIGELSAERPPASLALRRGVLPSSLVLQVPVDGPEAETEAEGPHGALCQVRRPCCSLGPPRFPSWGVLRAATSYQPHPVQAPCCQVGGADRDTEACLRPCGAGSGRARTPGLAFTAAPLQGG